MNGFTVANCKIHHQEQVSHVRLDSPASFICKICLSEQGDSVQFSSNIVDIPTFIAKVEKAANDIQNCEEKAFNRYSEMTELAGKFKVGYCREEDETIKEMLKILETENKDFKECCKR